MSDGIDFQPLDHPSDGIDFQPIQTDNNTGMFGQELKPGTTAPAEAFRQDVEGPGIQDVSASDALTVQGTAGLAKLGAGLAGKGVGTLLEKAIPAVSKANLGGLESIIPNTENVIPSIERVANNQTLKSMGGTMGQLGQMEKGRGGREAFDAGWPCRSDRCR